jgi:hypothetical protein
VEKNLKGLSECIKESKENLGRRQEGGREERRYKKERGKGEGRQVYTNPLTRNIFGGVKQIAGRKRENELDRKLSSVHLTCW